MSRETLVTQDGFDKLKAELEHLTTERRAEVAERIKTAREYGDISENAEYDDAKNEQARLEQRIMQLEERLRTAVVVTEVTSRQAGIGTKVTLRNKTSRKDEIFTLVGSTEVDPFADKISIESPVGKALDGHKKGDVVEVMLANGKKIKYEIQKIQVAK
jgi:transcription elongation factor GreA